MQPILDLTKKKLIKVGDVVKAKVLTKEARRMFLDLDIYGTGIVLGREYLTAANTIKNLKPGDELTVKVMGSINEDGYWELSLSEADKQAAWESVRELRDNKETITTTVLGANFGGLLLKVEGIEGFLPVSQLSLEHYPRVEGGDKSRILEELKKFAGKEIKVRVLDLDEKEGKLIFSEKEAQKDELLKAMTSYKVGDVVEGEITGLADFGVFIRFGSEFPLEGLIHISEIDYDLVDDPSQYVKVGDKVSAKIINVKDDRIFLSLKALKANPWDEVEKLYKKGKSYTGKVIKINPVGAFALFEKGIYGICPVASFEGSLDKLKQVLTTGNEYEFKITEVNQEDKRLILELAK